MNYVLESVVEAERLETQNKNELYSVEEELKGIEFSNGEKIIDIGCGTGAVSAEILKKNLQVDLTAIDISEIRIQQAKNLLPTYYKDMIKFQCLDLMDDTLPENSFDVVISRFVLHHLEEPLQMLISMKRVLKPGGRLIIIDSDGILHNYFCTDQWLMDCLSRIKEGMKLDMYIGRKLKSYYNYIELENIDVKMIPMHFKNESLTAEVNQYRERFSIMRDFFIDLLGQTDTDNFFSLYLKYLEKDSAELFYNKFVAVGHKI
ncbi:MAG: hypothetical protein COW01_12415 [Bdellovibrionales bacterium CG12_big_fil_rev_8_21_14_0_65_38_15]|nr:MAG: hypothetical protein COW79_05600 [Bdellovibrionales bacterium CG22_combo_CG10-13_8_21_14_all_38_13]PIQ53948.1 MAG: hypothetical protein COW01_12415 [Bdellovibrionales bacterium CG12_big_fil_rev_8_21_14_0_65_38_15]PIR30988.1 MAG: hypothetical protein COV38_02995 [Bdellovibrionales bacterium CG11_big_fil_rev_8_21_14_0_20_38_13]